MSDQFDSAIKEALSIIFGAIGIIAGVVAMMFIQLLPMESPAWVQAIIGVVGFSIVIFGIVNRWRKRKPIVRHREQC